MTDKTSTAPVMSLNKVRDQIRAFATVKERNCESKNYYVEMSVLLMDDWWKGIDARLNAPTPDVVGGDVVAWQCRCRLSGEWSEWQECEKDDFDKRTPLSGWDDGYLETEYRQLCVYAAPRVQGDGRSEELRLAMETISAWVTQGRGARSDRDVQKAWPIVEAALADQPKGEYPECSGDASSCPENEGYGCCGAKAHPAEQTRGDIFEAYKAWPDDLKAKLSLHDLRRMNGWAPKPDPIGWAIDTSAGGPILVYKGCSVIEGEDARYVMSLIASKPNPEQTRDEPVAVVGDTYMLHWIGSGPIAPLIERHGIKKGDKLYTAPRQAVPDGWQPIETAPNDGEVHARGLNVKTHRGWYFDVVAGYVDESGQFADLNGDITRWDTDDYEYWHPLAAAPSAGRMGVE